MLSTSGPFDIGQVLASGQEIDAVVVPLVVMVLTVRGAGLPGATSAWHRRS